MFTILFIKNKRLLLSLPTIFFFPNFLKLYRVLAEFLPLAEKSLLTTDPRKSLVTRCCGQGPEGQTGGKPGLTLERRVHPGGGGGRDVSERTGSGSSLCSARVWRQRQTRALTPSVSVGTAPAPCLSLQRRLQGVK